ncbi:hypothetical protein [Pseudarthrobacter sp. NIBRBAC000502770]|uniref:hypothetical protein n=1 Tax=Pseudarthrobacter sp. NIBRBAC000502770 TaxID=2590785 RepID=UPI0011402922|nr:hypothetical protein [Pseudarthrobacter sp. NIBRBAC000502770]QDG88179.1 hypothetical protein NIBR502770_06605 [Pseudarthrobacter sp. NIBRBAC000502770]
MKTAEIIAQDWSWIEPGDGVVVIEESDEFTAVIDTKTEDSHVVWTVGKGNCRRALDYRDGILILPL